MTVNEGGTYSVLNGKTPTYITNLTVSGGTLTVSGDGSNGNGIAGITAFEGEDASYEGSVFRAESATITVSKSSVQMDTVNLQNSKVIIDGSVEDGNTDTWQNNALIYGESSVTLGGSKSDVTVKAGGSIVGNTVNLTGGKVAFTGGNANLNSTGTAFIRTFGDDGSVHINGADVTVSNVAYIASENIRLNSADSELKINSDATLNLSAGLDRDGNTEIDGTLFAVTAGTLTNAGTVKISGDTEIGAGATVTNTGAITFNGDLDIASSAIDGLFGIDGNSEAKGKITLAANSAVTVTGSDELDFDAVKDKITASSATTWTQDNVALGQIFNEDNLALDVKNLTAEEKAYTATSKGDNAFVIEQGTITVSDSITLVKAKDALETGDEAAEAVAKGHVPQDRIYVYGSSGAATLNLVNDGSVTGTLVNVDRIYVGYKSSSHDASLNVDGSWNFADARIVAGQSGSVSLGGTVTNVNSLMLNGDGSVTVEEGANVTVQRLLGSEGGTGALTVNGNLAFTGDGLNDKEASSTEGEYVNDVNLLNTPVTVNAGGTLAFTTEDAWDDFLKKTVTDGVTSYEVLSTGGKTTDSGGWVSGNVTVNGTLALELGNVNLGEKDNVETLKTDLIGSGTGVLNIGSATYDLEQSDKGDGSYDYDAIAEGVSNSQTENAVVNVNSGSASDGITGEFGSVSLADDAGSDLNVKQDSTLILNQASAGNFVNTADSEAADVTVKSGAAVVLNGSGTVGDITKKGSEANTSAVLNANGGSQTAGKIDVASLTVQQGNVSVQSVTAETLTLTRAGLKVTGTGEESTANDITATSGSTVTSSSVKAGTITLGSASATSIHAIVGSDITADTLKLEGDASNHNTLNVNGGSVIDVTTFTGVSGAEINIGTDDTETTDSSTGSLHADTLDLNGATLTIDPEFDEKFAYAGGSALSTGNKLTGLVEVGKNSVFAVGFEDEDAVRAFAAEYGLVQANGALKEEYAALTILNDSVTIGDDTGKSGGIAMNGTATPAATANKIELGTGSALVLTEDAFGGRTDGVLGSDAAVSFDSNSGTVTATGNGKILLAGNFYADDEGTVFSGATSITGATADGIVIESLNGVLTGYVDSTGKITDLNVDEETFSQKITAASGPVKGLLKAALEGGDSIDKKVAGAEFLNYVAANTDGKEAEAAARMAVYGGAVQAALLAQQTSSDAVADRLGMASVNSSLVAADNAQGGALWLAPVYRNMDSDDFGAQGVDYGADIDLAGVALGADFTTDSGVRVGGYFNVGSGDADGQGVGSDVSNDFDYFGLGIYAGMTFGDLSVIADAGFTQVSSDLEQNTVTADKLTADTDTDVVSVGLKGEYKLSTAFVDVVPHLGVRYTRLDMDSYDVKSQYGVIASASSDTMDVVSVPFGVSLSKDIAAGDWTVKPVFDLTLAANAADDEFDSDVTFTGMGTSAALSTEVLDDFTYGASLGVSAKYADSLSVGVNVGYTGSDNTDSFGVAGTLRYMF